MLLAPHIGNQGYGNDGWVDSYKGIPTLFARRADVSLAVMCDAGWRAASAGYVGVNDGWRQVREAGALTDLYTEARDGNIALTRGGGAGRALAARATIARWRSSWWRWRSAAGRRRRRSGHG